MFEQLLSRGGLSLERLRTLCMVADARGIAKAAGNDAVKQSLFSRQIRELEEFFGTELTTRRGKHIALTTAGERLARIVREHFQALSDFDHESRSEPVTLRIGASNSVLEWILIPKLSYLRRALPNVLIELTSERTAEIVRGLNELNIDLAIVRKDAAPLRTKALTLPGLHYSLFLPAALVPNEAKSDVRIMFATLAIATSRGGMFREVLETAAAKAGIPLRIDLSCASFAQAARAVQSGGYAAVLPSIAASVLPMPAYVQIALPFLKSYKRDLALVWNPRLANVRPIVEKSRDVLMALLLQ